MGERRTTKERRSKSGRRRRFSRRYTDDRVAVVEITGSALNLAVLDRNADASPDQVQVSIVPWRHNAATLNSELGEKELGEAFRSIAQEFQLQTAQLHIVLGGEFCVTKAIRGKKEDVRSELQQLKLRSRLYLMLGPGEKVSVSNSWPIDARHEYAVAAICNRKTLEVIHSAATNAGMTIDRIEPALVSISRVIGRIHLASDEPSLAIHLNKNTTELGICHNGKLLLDYRPGGLSDSKDLIEVVATHLSRLQRHVGRQLREAPPQLKDIYLCGDSEIVDGLHQKFADFQQFNVVKIDPHAIQATWEFQNSNADSSSVPSLGTLLSTYLPENERDAPNFMDHVLASTRVPLGPTLLRCALPFAALFLVACGLMFANYREKVAVSTLQRKVDALLPAQGYARELQLKLIAMKTKLKEINRLAEGVQALPAEGVLNWIGHCMPSDVWLSSLVVEEMHSVKIAGASYLEAGVFDFVRWLEQSPHFKDVALQSTRQGQSSSGATINFDVELNLNDSDDSTSEVASND